MSKPQILRWVIAHEPVHLFERTARAFGDEIERISNGRVKVEIWTQSDYYDRLNNGVHEEHPDVTKMFKHLEAGDFDMFQTTVGWFRFINNNFLALDLPFLFRDHDHVTRVLEGPIGKGLCDSLALKSNVKGLAFTYSGGYRVIGSTEPLESIDDLNGKRIKCGSPLHYLTHQRMGAVPVSGEPASNIGYDVLEGREVDTVDTTYLRFKGNHILKTNHAMFMTTIAINKDVWNSFDEETRAFMEQAAVSAARIERAWSIQDAEEFERTCQERGVTIVEVSEEERDRLREQLQPVYEDSREWFANGLVEAIRMH